MHQTKTSNIVLEFLQSIEGNTASSAATKNTIGRCASVYCGHVLHAVYFVLIHLYFLHSLNVL